MSTATFCLSQSVQPVRCSSSQAASRGLMIGTGLIIGLAFFLAGHDLRVSLAEAYTQNAEEM